MDNLDNLHNLDNSEIIIKDLNRSIVNLYKLCFEEMGYDLGATYNKIEYKNYLYDNPIHLANTDESFLYDNAPTKLTKEDMEFIKSLNIQDGGEGLEHQGNFTDKGNFVKTMFNGFISKGVNNVVSVCMTAQAALESDWGKSHYAHFSNYGGINYHKGADYKIPGKSAHGHTKAGYNNLGRYIEEKIGIMNRLYPGALNASTPEKYFDIIQGNNPNHYCYGGENAQQRAAYGKLVMNVIASVKKYLT